MLRGKEKYFGLLGIKFRSLYVYSRIEKIFYFVTNDCAILYRDCAVYNICVMQIEINAIFQNKHKQILWINISIEKTQMVFSAR